MGLVSDTIGSGTTVTTGIIGSGFGSGFVTLGSKE